MAIYQGSKELTLNNVSTVKHGGVAVYYKTIYPVSFLDQYIDYNGYGFNMFSVLPDNFKINEIKDKRIHVFGQNYYDNDKKIDIVFDRVHVPFFVSDTDSAHAWTPGNVDVTEFQIIPHNGKYLADFDGNHQYHITKIQILN